MSEKEFYSKFRGVIKIDIDVAWALYQKATYREDITIKKVEL
jgi:hypothetical protein